MTGRLPPLLALLSCGSTPEEKARNEGRCDLAADCVDAERYVADLEFVAQERVPGSAHWQAVQDLCAEVFADAGLEVERHAYGSGVNVVGTLAGNTGEMVLFTAHYDHIAGCEGADDNASGLAAVLELARVLGQTDWERTLVLACWDEEERGLVGSSAWAEREAAEGAAIAMVYNFDMIGYASDEPDSQELPDGIETLFPEEYEEIAANGFRGDFLAAVGDDEATEALLALGDAADGAGLPFYGLPFDDALLDTALLADLSRSDHAPFWELGYPAVFMGDTGEYRNARYHCRGGPDNVDSLDLDFAVRVVRATAEAGAGALSR